MSRKNNKTAFIIVRVLKEEKEKIVKKAEDLGLSISGYVRNKLGIEND